MTHRSRICAVLVDSSAKTHQAVARFWSGALGRKLDYAPQERYASLPGPHLDCIVQRVEPGREGVHFDIETDDVDAEVARLEKLGAKRGDYQDEIGREGFEDALVQESQERAVAGARTRFGPPCVDLF